MPRFEPFAGIRYRAADLSAVICPPYDVISDEQRLALEAADPHNAVRLELPQDDGRVDRYTVAARRLRSWLATDGPLAVDPDPAFYCYRMRFTDEAGRPRTTTGVIGALRLEPPGEGDILPHERTTPKARSDRADLLRSTRANLSPVWGLSLAGGLSDQLGPPPGPPPARATDGDGVVHEVWPVTDPATLTAITAAVATAPVVLADGHHRYEVALALQAEQRAAGVGAGPWDAVMAFLVELAEEQLSVEAIHRLVSGLPDGFDLVEALAEWFDVSPTEPPGATVTARMVSAGGLVLVTGEGTWLLRPRPATLAKAEHDLDSSRLDVALAGLPIPVVTFQHGVAKVIEAVAAGAAQAGFLLRPATVAQIAGIAHARERMPPKTTFFTPKPATGLVFRSIAPGA